MVTVTIACFACEVGILNRKTGQLWQVKVMRRVTVFKEGKHFALIPQISPDVSGLNERTSKF